MPGSSAIRSDSFLMVLPPTVRVGVELSSLA
jgi:hypothetical protein